MALGTYAELCAAVANELARSDLTSVIPDFIVRAEAKFNRELRVSEMESRATATATEYMELPTDFLELRNIQLNTTPKVALEVASPAWVDKFQSDAAGKPLYYCLIANQIQLAPAPDTGYDVEIDYYAKVPDLATNSTNWLLTAHPDLYLYSACLEASAHIADDARLPAWQNAVSTVMKSINDADKRKRWAGNVMRQRPSRCVV